MSTVERITNTATTTWKCPAGVYKIIVECIGGGGSTHSEDYWATPASGAGYGKKTLVVTPGFVYGLSVGVRGESRYAVSVNGTPSTFSLPDNTVVCRGDGGNNSGNTAGTNNIGDVTHRGGNGSGNQTYGGGGAGGPNSNGGDSVSSTGGIGGGDDAGNGGNVNNSGSNYGGGAGGTSSSWTQLYGGVGIVKITYDKVNADLGFSNNF